MKVSKAVQVWLDYHASHSKKKTLTLYKSPDDRIFPITYEAARMMVIKSGNVVGIHLRPHDLRRHSATYASRSGVPIEIVSKIILRLSNLSTTQSLNCVPSKS